jgi:hypothetical protein
MRLSMIILNIRVHRHTVRRKVGGALLEDRVYLNIDRVISPQAYTLLGKIMDNTLRGSSPIMVIKGRNLKLTSQTLFELQRAVSFSYKDPVSKVSFTYPLVKDFTVKVNPSGEPVAIQVRLVKELPELAAAMLRGGN